MPKEKNLPPESADDSADFQFELAKSPPEYASIKIVYFASRDVSPPPIYGADWISVDLENSLFVEYSWETSGCTNMPKDPMAFNHPSLASSLEGCDLVIVLFSTTDNRQLMLVNDLGKACSDQVVGLSIAVQVDGTAVSSEYAAGSESTTHSLFEAVDCYLVCDTLEVGIEATRNIVELITNNSIVGLDYMDVKTVLAKAGRVFWEQSSASGDKRAVIASQTAVDQLPDSLTIHRALMIMEGGLDIDLDEWSCATDVIEKNCSDEGIWASSIILDVESTDTLQISVLVSETPYADGSSHRHAINDASKPETEAPLDIPEFLRRQLED